MKALTTSIRLLIAERLLSLVMEITPKNIREGQEIFQMIHDYHARQVRQMGR